MDRRGFLKFFAPAAVGAVVAAPLIEELIWTPHRSYFLPPVGGWGNRLLTLSQITQEALRILEKELLFSYQRQKEYSDDFKRTGGYTVNVGRPPRYLSAIEFHRHAFIESIGA